MMRLLLNICGSWGTSADSERFLKFLRDRVRVDYFCTEENLPIGIENWWLKFLIHIDFYVVKF